MGIVSVCRVCDMFRPLLSLLLVAAATQGSVLKSDEKLKFSVIASRSIEEPPTIDVTFANGMQDALDLSHFRMHEQATVGCNYHGTLKTILLQLLLLLAA